MRRQGKSWNGKETQTSTELGKINLTPPATYTKKPRGQKGRIMAVIKVVLKTEDGHEGSVKVSSLERALELGRQMYEEADSTDAVVVYKDGKAVQEWRW